MLFNSYPFIFIFLPVTLIAFALARQINHRLALVVLLAASFFFYGYWDPKYVLLLLGSIAANYLLSIAIERSKAWRGWWLALGIAMNLAVLAWFKYAYFVHTNFLWYVGNLDFLGKIILPLGISFYTFEQIAYLVDTKRGRVRTQDPLTYGLFVTFFPHLIAGPIILYQDMARQFLTRHTLGSVKLIKFHSGLILFAIGLFKKVVIADGFGAFATPIFIHAALPGTSIGTIDAWLGALFYSLQLYFDFSGYSDMAVGLARMFGYRLPFNFNSPYKATSIIDFWRRWHMTLTNFFRKYVYIPLGGNQLGLQRQSVNIMIVFFLTGLWHGAGWNFILWGTIHGILVLGTHLWFQLEQGRLGLVPGVLFDDRYRRARAVFGWAFTLLCVVLLWVLFRAADLSTAVIMIRAMLLGLVQPTAWYASILLGSLDGYVWALATLGVGWAIALFAPNSMAVTAYLASSRPRGLLRRMTGQSGTDMSGFAARFGASSVFIGVVLYFAVTTLGQVRSEFLYFQF